MTGFIYLKFSSRFLHAYKRLFYMDAFGEFLRTPMRKNNKKKWFLSEVSTTFFLEFYVVNDSLQYNIHYTCMEKGFPMRTPSENFCGRLRHPCLQTHQTYRCALFKLNEIAGRMEFLKRSGTQSSDSLPPLGIMGDTLGVCHKFPGAIVL